MTMKANKSIKIVKATSACHFGSESIDAINPTAKLQLRHENIYLGAAGGLGT
jgi:hypothetical protein